MREDLANGDRLDRGPLCRPAGTGHLRPVSKIVTLDGRPFGLSR
jgi:hypothetical protein